jgi:hypothetical protein
MASKTKDEKVQARLIEMLRDKPRAAGELSVYYRRHLRTLEKAGKIAVDGFFVWHVVEGH